MEARTSSVIFPFSTGNSLMAKFVCTNQSCQFRLKFGTYTNLNMQNSMLVLAAAVLKNQKQPLVDVLRNRCS